MFLKQIPRFSSLTHSRIAFEQKLFISPYEFRITSAKSIHAIMFKAIKCLKINTEKHTKILPRFRKTNLETQQGATNSRFEIKTQALVALVKIKSLMHLHTINGFVNRQKYLL